MCAAGGDSAFTIVIQMCRIGSIFHEGVFSEDVCGLFRHRQSQGQVSGDDSLHFVPHSVMHVAFQA